MLWQALAEGDTRQGLIDKLVETYDVGRSTAESDVDEFLADLRARDFLVG